MKNLEMEGVIDRREHLKRFRGAIEVDKETLDYVRTKIKDDIDGKIIVDLGCGDGERVIGELIGTEAKKIIGIEIDDHMISKAKEMKAKKETELGRKLDSVYIIQGDLQKIPLADKSVDRIVSTFSFFPPDVSLALEELKRVTKDDGEIIIANTFPEIEDKEVLKEITEESKPNSPRFPITINNGQEQKESKGIVKFADEYRVAFEKAGLEIIEENIEYPENIKIPEGYKYKNKIDYKQITFILKIKK